MSMKGIKNRGGSKWKRAAIFFALLLFFGVLLNSVNNVYQKKKSAQETLARMEKEAQDLKNREEYLKDSLQRLQTDEGVKFEMRKKLNVAEAGESVAIIVEENQTTSAQSSQTSAWQKIRDFFAGLFE